MSASDTIVTRWWWVRHAPVTVNEGRIYGQQDLPCDTSNADRFKWLADHLPEQAALVTSALMRTHQTADAIAAQGLSLPERHEEAGLNEQSFGDWHGLTYDEFHALQGKKGPSYWLAPAFERAPNGESFTDLVARVVPVVTRLSNHHGDADIICTSHGGTIRAALAYALGISPDDALRFSIANLSVTRLDCIENAEGRHWRVCFVNREPDHSTGRLA